MKNIFIGTILFLFAGSVSGQVAEKEAIIQSQGANTETARAAWDDFSWDPVYTRHMTEYEKKMNSDYSLLMGKMNLTEEQKNQLKKITDRSIVKLHDIYMNTDLTNNEVAFKHREIVEERSAQIKSILTPDQKIQYNNWLAANPYKWNDLTWRSQWAHYNMSLDKMREELSLTDEQYDNLLKLDASFKEKKLEIHNDASLTKEQKKMKIKALMDEKHIAYRTLLNADQITKFEMDKDGSYKIKTREGNEMKKIKSKD